MLNTKIDVTYASNSVGAKKEEGAVIVREMGDLTPLLKE